MDRFELIAGTVLVIVALGIGLLVVGRERRNIRFAISSDLVGWGWHLASARPSSWRERRGMPKQFFGADESAARDYDTSWLREQNRGHQYVVYYIVLARDPTGQERPLWARVNCASGRPPVVSWNPDPGSPARHRTS